MDQQYRNLNTNYSASSARDEALGYLDGLFNELNDDSSMTTAIGKFFTALNTFTSDTSSSAYRTNVQQQAISMTESFHNVYEEMKSLWQDQNNSISTVASKVTSLAQKIADLNDAIARSMQTVGTANDLSDQRNLLLDELSGYVNITYSNNTSNPDMVDVKIGNLSLVDGNSAHPIISGSAADHTARIDTLTTQIASINNQVSSGSMTVSDAQTAMTPLLTELNTYITVSASANAANADLTDVKYNGVSLVTGNTAAAVATAVDSDLSTWVQFNRNNLTLGGNALAIESGNVTGGQLYANMVMLTSQGDTNPGIPTFMKQLNTLVQNMAKNLNDINSSGWTYPDGTTPSQTGINLFKVPSHVDPATGTTVYDYDKLNAGTFTLSNEVAQSGNYIAGSSVQIDLSSTSTNTGDNTVALKLAKDLANSGYYDKLNSIVSNLAIASNTTASVMDTKESLLKSVDAQRKSTSAVSLDEETTNLIIFQQAYNAAARVITTLDDMLDKMINTMGV